MTTQRNDDDDVNVVVVVGGDDGCSYRFVVVVVLFIIKLITGNAFTFSCVRLFVNRLTNTANVCACVSPLLSL